MRKIDGRIEPVTKSLVDGWMVEEVEVVQPPEMARVLDRKRNVPAATGVTAGTAGVDQQVPDYAPERVATAGRDRGADRIVVRPGEKVNLATVTP